MNLGASVDLDRLIADVHRDVNRFRRKNKLPEWDFSKKPKEQAWKADKNERQRVRRATANLRRKRQDQHSGKSGVKKK